MMTTRSVPRVMLLIDADNVTADVIEQAVHHVLERHGAAHVRRAYCTTELAHKHLKLFKAHSIRPMVNISTGKNSTDIALAVDAMDLVLSERPDVAVLVSSDSDFAPLVIRLREKGCRVEGIGQEGKTGDDSKPVYDDFVDIAHRKARVATTADEGVVARLPAARKAASKGAASKRTAADGRSGARRSATKTAAPAADAGPAPVAAKPAESAPPSASPVAEAEPQTIAVAKRTRRTAASRRGSASGADTASRDSSESGTATATGRGRGQRKSNGNGNGTDTAPRPAPDTATTTTAVAPREQTRASPSSNAALPDEVERILAALPELNYGARVQLNQARERLHAAGLLARSAPSTKLFRKHPTLFALTPEKAPNKVQFLRPNER